MRYRLLGRTGLKVSELSFGTMTFGGTGMWTAVGALDQPSADFLVACCLEAGINLFDTADFYAAGESETMLGRALGARRKEVLVATKVRLKTGPGPNDVGLSRGHILGSAEASLARLGTDWIDLYQIHLPDPLTPIDETLRALEDLVRSGKVRYVGASNLMAWQLMKSLGIAERRGFTRFESLQAYYNLVARELEREIVPLLHEEKVGLLVWSPLAGGFLSGKIGRDAPPPAGARLAQDSFLPLDRERAFRIVDAMRAVAQARGASVAQVALAWLLARGVVTSVILGARRREQLEDNLKASEVALGPEELGRLDEASAFADEYPVWMFRRSTDRTP